MQVLSGRVIVVSLLVCLVISVAGGLAYALLGDRVVAHGIGTGLLVIGIIVLWMALLGATEPREGWASRKRAAGRRSVAARLAADRELEGVSSLSLAVWGIVVGGSLVGLSLVAFYLA
jgi:hypothetical protein